MFVQFWQKKVGSLMAKLDDLQSTYKEDIRELEKKAKKQEEDEITAVFDPSSFIKRQELRSYIGNYRRALEEIKKGG